MSEAVELIQMLEAREKRVWRQQTLLAQYPGPLICFTMNIAGPVKNSDLIRSGFALGNRILRQQLAKEKLTVLHTEAIDEITGNEACYCIAADPLAVKRITTDIEDHTELGRLFDMDVLLPDGSKVERSALGLAERRCLICGGPARECARSRTHTVAQLQTVTKQMLESATENDDARYAAALAVRALNYEVCTSRKPGLVDRVNSGSHRDMDLFTFLRSSSVLFPYFESCCRIGRRTQEAPPVDSFRALRWPGKEAEGIMLEATGNVNTHKGAIFSAGILCGALGRLPRAQWSRPEAVLNMCAAMTAGLTEGDFRGVTAENARTVGQRLYVRYGITGVRGQAEAGFPAVLQYGLPVLEAGLAEGRTVDEAGCAAMLSMLCHSVDTNLIARSDRQTQQAVAARVLQILEQDPYPDGQTLRELDEAFIRKNLSPGGSADLLAICYFLHFLRGQE